MSTTGASSDPLDGLALPGGDDTIAAIATAQGRSAVAMIRLSGAGALDIASRVVSPWPIPPRRPVLRTLRHPTTGEVLDRALVTAHPDDNTYTGEPVVELSTHGGWLVPAAVLDAVLAAGARTALPGEFTRRAVVHGRMDLLQAEAIGDLIDARSTATRRAALRQMDGGLSDRIQALRERIIGIEALIAYEIDFPEEDDGPVPPERVLTACVDALDDLERLLATAHAGELIREGALVVLAGAPNTGKSSLFNALLGEARAIVTDVPGTTRDALEVVLDTAPWPIRLVDTAGLRQTSDIVERLGVEVSERYLGAADLILACAETPAALEPTVERIGRASPAPVLGVLTKHDLVADRDDSPGDLVPGSYQIEPVSVSAHAGTGLSELLGEIGCVLSRVADSHPAAEAPLLTR